MSEIPFTNRQLDAIRAPVSNILVSAAAGSGKTAVLTERIIQNLLDPEKQVGISDMLVVTFTKAAASELKSRISSSLGRAYSKDIANKKLRKQLMEIEGAHISTIHSFYLDLIKEYHERLSLPSLMKITSPSESQLLYRGIMDSVIDERYEKDTEEFNRFAENFISLRDGRLADMLLDFYEKLSSYPDGVEYVKNSRDRLLKVAQTGIDGSEYMSQVKAQLSSMCVYFCAICESAIDALRSRGEEYAIQADVFESDLNYFKVLRSADDMKYCEIASLMKDFKFAIMKGAGKISGDDLYYLEQRDMYKNQIRAFCKSFFSESEESIKRSAQNSAHFCGELYKTLKAYEEISVKEKMARSMLDYDDLEKYAYMLLCPKDGDMTVAKEVSRRFAQIYIDEYQDINPVQDAIFSAIGQNNIFMVGDIKQSIYGFRGSAPRLFAKYREDYKDYQPGKKQDNVRMFLSENFRCDKNIIDFSNMVFASLFVHDRVSVPYLAEDALVFKKNSDPSKSEKVTVALVETAEDSVKEQNEAKYVACEVARLIGEGTKPSEIAIILRKTKGVAEIYEKELEKLGIKYRSSARRELFRQPEIMLISSILECLDNPRGDISLSALLTSPFFAFTVEDLSKLAFTGEKGVYNRLLKYMDRESCGELYDKCLAFTDWFDQCRERSREMTVSELIRFVLDNLSFEAVVSAKSDCSEDVGDNLSSFLSIAVEFESNSFCCLSDFVRHIEKLKSSSVETDSLQNETEDDNEVNIVSVHGSKGLEYPICFVCDLHRQVNSSDVKQDLIVDRELGITLRMKDDSGYVKYDTFMRKASALHVAKEQINEEMRVLYVALTRAKKKLYLTASTPAPKEFAKRGIRGLASSYYAYSKNASFIKWILSSLKEDDCYEIKYIMSDDLTVPAENKTNSFENEKTNKYDESAFEKAKNAIEFVYPWNKEQKLPSKLAVSALYPEILDEEEDVMNRSVKERPDFMSHKTLATGAERGTATHVFMQFCDFEKVERYGVEDELLRLVEQKYMTEESAKLVYADKVNAFFDCELYRLLKKSKKVYREYRFNVRIPASEFTEKDKELYARSDAKILVQGVIDCFFENENGSYTIIDYKTDRAFCNDPEAQIALEYRSQLMYYKKALEIITRKKVTGASIFAFDLGKEIKIKL